MIPQWFPLMVSCDNPGLPVPTAIPTTYRHDNQDCLHWGCVLGLHFNFQSVQKNSLETCEEESLHQLSSPVIIYLGIRCQAASFTTPSSTEDFMATSSAASRKAFDIQTKTSHELFKFYLNVFLEFNLLQPAGHQMFV